MSRGQSPGIGGVARRLRDRVRNALAPAEEPESRSLAPVRPEPAPEPTARTATPPADSGKGVLGRLAADRKRAAAAQAELDELTAERDRLRAERLAVQQELGRQAGKTVQPRLRVEKTNGTPSFVVATRMMQRIYARGADPKAGLDGIGTVFADRAETKRYAISHGVPVLEEAESAIEPTVVAHALKGQTPLVEVHGEKGVRHFRANGEDAGDIRPAVTHDPTIEAPKGYSDIVAWSKRLSRFIPRPYVQIHWSLTPEGPRLHHVDVDPDRVPVLTPEWDKRLGLAFDGSYARFIKQPFRRGGLDNRVRGGTFTPEEHV